MAAGLERDVAAVRQFNRFYTHQIGVLEERLLDTPFSLTAGNYLVGWTISSAGSGGCNAIGAIHTPDGKTSVEVA